MAQRFVGVAACVAGWLTGAGAGVSGTTPAASRRVEITASKYAFEPAQVEVHEGETVELVLRSADTEHGLAIKAYGVKVKIPKGGAPVTASFVADKAGRFPFTCSEYCGSGHRRMRGQLVVTELEQ